MWWRLLRWIMPESRREEELRHTLMLYAGAVGVCLGLAVLVKSMMYGAPRISVQKGAVLSIIISAFVGALGAYWLVRQRARRELRGDVGTRDWFAACAFFIPRAIREPWHGDICEDRAYMANHGRSRWLIELATLVQLVCLILACLREIGIRLIERLIRNA